MVSRISTFLSCTSCFTTIVILTVIGLVSTVVGFIGLGIYIPTYKNNQAYTENICTILSHEYDDCQHANTIMDNSCYSITWSVQYMISKSTSDRYIFSTITLAYGRSTEALEKLSNYPDKTNHTCYYHTVNVAIVQWDEPSSPKPYLIMMITGFSLACVYFIILGFIVLYRRRTRKSRDIETKIDSISMNDCSSFE